MEFWYLTWAIGTSFVMGMVAYRLMQLIVRGYYRKPRPRYRRKGWR